MNNHSLTIIQGFNLSSLFGVSIFVITLLGITSFLKGIERGSYRVKKLQRNLIALFILIELSLAIDFLVYISERFFYLFIIDLAVILLTFFFGMSIYFRFSDFFERKLAVLTILFGFIAIVGLIGVLFFESILTHAIHLIGISVSIGGLYLLVMKSLVDSVTVKDKK